MGFQYSNQEEFEVVSAYLEGRANIRKERGRVPKGIRELERDVLLYIGRDNSKGYDPCTFEIAQGLGMRRGAANVSSLVHRINWYKPERIEKIRDRHNVRHRLTSEGWHSYHSHALFLDAKRELEQKKTDHNSK